MLIAVIGPEGSGRTTLAKSLAENHSDIEYLYLGHDSAKRTYRWFDAFIKSRRSQSWVFAPFRKLLIAINDWREFVDSRNSIKIVDHCVLDALALGEVTRKRKGFFATILLHFFPKPDLIFLLGGDPNLIWRRKQNQSPETIKSHSAIYRKFIDTMGVKYKNIDTTKNSVERSNKIALDYILEC